VDGHGLVDPTDLAAAIIPRTVLVSIMLAGRSRRAGGELAATARLDV